MDLHRSRGHVLLEARTRVWEACSPSVSVSVRSQSGIRKIKQENQKIWPQRARRLVGETGPLLWQETTRIIRIPISRWGSASRTGLVSLQTLARTFGPAVPLCLPGCCDFGPGGSFPRLCGSRVRVLRVQWRGSIHETSAHTGLVHPSTWSNEFTCLHTCAAGTKAHL